MDQRVQGIGKPVLRVEDRRLLTGQGNFSDDFNLPGQAYAAVVRSPHAHATVKSIDSAPARDMPGMFAVLTGADYLADGINPIPLHLIGRSIVDPAKPSLWNKDGSEIFTTPIYPIANDRVRHVGDVVALVVAATANQAKDAAERVTVEYEILPAVTDMAAAISDGAPQIWQGAARNVCIDIELGDAAAAKAAFANADHVVSLDVANNRVAPISMEPRAAVGDFDPGEGAITLYAAARIASCISGCSPAPSICRRRKCGWSPTTSVADSVCAARSIPNFPWLCGPPCAWRGRSNGRRTAARRS